MFANSEPQVGDEEFLCCPRCRSKELHAEKKGFSAGNAIAGVVLAGGLGLLAGTLGSQDIKITCLKCGNRFKAGDAIVVKFEKKPPIRICAIDARPLEKRIYYLLSQDKRHEASMLYMSERAISVSETVRYIDEICLKYNFEV